MTTRRGLWVIAMAVVCSLAPLRLAADQAGTGGPAGGHGMFMHRFGGGPPMMHDGPAFMLPMLMHGLSLSDAQRTQIHQIMANDRSTLGSLFQQLHQAEDALNDQLVAPGTKQASDLAPQIQQITQLRQQLLQQGVASMLQIRAVLTPDQIAQLAQKKQRLSELRTEMENLMGPMPAPPEAP